MSGSTSGTLPKSPATEPPEGQCEAGAQYQITGLLIQDLLKSVRGFQTSLESIRAKVEGSGSLPESNKPSTQEETTRADAVAATEEGRRSNPSCEDNVTDAMASWPSSEKIAQYKERCAIHIVECEKMQEELGYLISHLNLIGGNKRVSDDAESVRKQLLNIVRVLEKGIGDEKQNPIRGLKDVLGELSTSVHTFYVETSKSYDEEIRQWNMCINDGCHWIEELLGNNTFIESMDYIHNIFFSYQEAAMGGLIGALTAFEDKSVNDWLAAQKIDDLEKRCREYITQVFPPTRTTRVKKLWPDQMKIDHFVKRFKDHRKTYNRMQEEIGHLIAHYGIIGGDKLVIQAAESLQMLLLSPAEHLQRFTVWQSPDSLIEIGDAFRELLFAAARFQGGLYNKKHAFYFRNIKQWVNCLKTGVFRILGFLCRGQPLECIEYMHNNFLPEVEYAMNGMALAGQFPLVENHTKAGEEGVPEELKAFGKESLPKFLVDQMERDTTRYINLTTIATFFSSVTATTLQFTFAPLQSEASESLRGVVNLFWFLSLVFSVSSGVSSLLGLTWRKSSIYDSRAPPKLIRMWFDKAPMLFLVIAAVAFVVGLNLFAFLSLQPRYVSFSTTILTCLHGMCFATVTVWFIYQLKHESIWAGWVRKVTNPITELTGWIGVGAKWVCEITKRPYEKFKEDFHLQRNIYWAFGIDNRVAHLNYEISWSRDWPEPYLPLRLIRCIVCPIKKCSLVTKKALYALSRTVDALMCKPSHVVNAEDDFEMGERSRQADTEVPEETTFESLAKNKFRKSLQAVFGEANCVDRIMRSIDDWEDEIIANTEIAKQVFGGILWGYPDLAKNLFEIVGSSLAEARERRREEREKGRRQDLSILEVVPEDKIDTASVPPLCHAPTPLVDGSGPSASSKEGAQLDIQSHPDNHVLALDEPALLMASGNTEVTHGPQSEDPIPQPYREEVKEVQSISWGDNDGLHNKSRKEGPEDGCRNS